MRTTNILFLCVIGLVSLKLASSEGELLKFFQSLGQKYSQNHNTDGDQTCDHVDRKDHAINLLKEWVKHNHYEAIEKLYHDIYHKDLQNGRRKRQWHHHYKNDFDEAFTNGNKVPSYMHVEGYIWTNMNAACRNDIMVWIEDLAKHHTTEAPTTIKVTKTHVNHQSHNTQHPTDAPTNAPTDAPTNPPTNAPTNAPTDAPTTLAVKTTCEPVTFVTALARGTILSNANAGLCTDGTHTRSEALVLESCKAPQVSQWSKGMKVMGNCENIPDYTPVATFSFGNFVQDGNSEAGIITECTPNGFKMAIQLCGNPVDVYELKSGAATPSENADNYYVINF